MPKCLPKMVYTNEKTIMVYFSQEDKIEICQCLANIVRNPNTFVKKKRILREWLFIKW